MHRTAAFILTVTLLVLTVTAGLARAGSPSGVAASPAATPVTIDVDLPSSSTGVPGGTLAVRIFAPATAGDARYADGAPVIISAPGGTIAGSLRPTLEQAGDVIRIVFLFPGGNDPLTGRTSDGTYDYRGPNSIAALRDVILYAAGELTDASGNTIDDVLPVAVLHDNIGLLGSSNGGNIVVAAAAEHGAGLAGRLRYIIQWESPVSSQIATVDLGRVNLDCPPGRRESLLAVNPRYLTYGPLTLGVDYSQLTYNASDPLHRVFFDGTGDGRYTTVTDPGNGCQTPDLDLNGTLELDEDFPLSTYSDGVKQFYSRPVTQALADQNVFGGSWPADIATPAQANAFWNLREAVRLYDDALTNIPDLEGMILASVVDHVQSAPDHPHIRQALEALTPPSPLSQSWERGVQGGEGWVKINPDRDYVLEVDPTLSARTDLPDNAANAAPSDWTDASSYAYPEGLDEVYFAAAVHEMADRAQAASATLTPTPTATPTATPSPTATATATAPTASDCVSDVNSDGRVDVVDIMATAANESCRVYLPIAVTSWRRPWPPDTPTPTATPTATSTPESWVYEETVFYSEGISRPELCFVGDRAYLALRQVVQPEGGGPADRFIVLKVFDVGETGAWTDRTADLFPDDPHVLYGPGDPHEAGDFTDHQLLCADGAFFLVFEATYLAEGGRMAHTVVRRYHSDWKFDRQTALLESSKEKGSQTYKSDDPGAALLNGTLFAWVVELGGASGAPVTGFALYGLDPVTLDVVVDDGAGGPRILANPEQAPFAGVMDFIDGEYRLLTSPRAAGEHGFTQDGLMDCRYEQDWDLLSCTVVEDPFGSDRPLYTTSRLRYGGVEVWGFTVMPADRSQDEGVIGQAWVRLAGPDGGAAYFLVSGNDATPADDDTRHTELAVHDGKVYVSYFHLEDGDERATTIKRYRIPASEEVPPLYFFYAIHTHVQGDWYPYTDPGMTNLDPAVANNMIAAIEGMAGVLDDHGARGSWEVVYGTSRGLCTYQGENHIFQQLLDSGHEVGVHAHRTEHIDDAFQNLQDFCGITSNLTSGFMIEASSAGPEGAQEAASQAIEAGLALGMTAGTENMSPDGGRNPFGELCDNQVGVGNDMWAETGNLMFPWRPDYANRNICADNPAGGMVFVDHVGPDWMSLPGTGMVDVLTDANFDQLRQQFDAALAYMEENRPVRVAAWGFVSHINEYAVGNRGENPPDPAALAALDRFLDYVDTRVAEGRVVYATAGQIADLAFPAGGAGTPTPTPTATPGSPGVSPNWGPEYQVSNTGGYSGGAVGRTLAVDSQNRLHVLWTEQGGSSFDVYYARSSDGGQTWSAGRDIVNSPLPAFGGNIAVGPDDTLHAVWGDRRDGPVRLYYSRSTDGGDTWEAPREISGGNTTDAAGQSISVDTRNRVHITWHIGDPNVATPAAQVYYARSTDGGDTFEAPRRLNTGTGHAAFPRFSVEGTTGDLVAIAWRDNRRNPDWDVYLAVSTDGGASFTERVGQASSQPDWDPEAVVDTEGVIHLGIMTYRPGGITVDYQRSTDQGQTWSEQVTLSEAFSRFPFWAPDNAHGVLWLFWKDERDFSATPACTGQNHCADLAGKYSTDGGLSWSAMEFATDLGEVEVKFPSFAVGPDGRVHAVWSDQRYGAERETVFVRSRLAAPVSEGASRE